MKSRIRQNPRLRTGGEEQSTEDVVDPEDLDWKTMEEVSFMISSVVDRIFVILRPETSRLLKALGR